MLHSRRALLSGVVPAEPLAKSVASAPCKTPPTIDGRIGVDEWRDAKVFDFDMEMVGVNPPVKAKRACQLWLMNSANAHYRDTHHGRLPISLTLSILRGLCLGTCWALPLVTPRHSSDWRGVNIFLVPDPFPGLLSRLQQNPGKARHVIVV